MKTGRKAKIQRLKNKLAQLERQARAESERLDQLSNAFHIGTVGSAGRRTPKRPSLDKTIDRAVQMQKLRAQIADLTVPIRPKITRTYQPTQPQIVVVNERAAAIRRWYFYGSADEEPPYDDITEAELCKIRKGAK